MNTRLSLLRCILLPLLLSLIACDIEPVAAGRWSIQTETQSGTESSEWVITASGAIAVSGGSVSILDESIVLAGSRISWSGTMANPDDPAQLLNVNFNGTVDRNTLQGTLFTTLGNWSIVGSRQ